MWYGVGMKHYLVTAKQLVDIADARDGVYGGPLLGPVDHSFCEGCAADAEQLADVWKLEEVLADDRM
jgi:hypothetical protein